MLTIIDKESEIKNAQKLFETILKKFSDEQIITTTGHKGKNWDTPVLWSDSLGIWYCFEIIEHSRYWNAFGVGKPSPRRQSNIVCEINFPIKGIDRSVGGVFVKDNSGEIFVVHRGRIAGGRPGIGKSLFMENFKGDWTEIDDAGEQNIVALIGSLSDPNFPENLSKFVIEVDRIKKLMT